MVIIGLAENTLIHALTTQATVDEALRNVRAKRPAAEAHLLALIARVMHVTPLPPGILLEELASHAHAKDVLNLAAAIHAQAHVLLTFNVKDYRPPASLLRVMTPGRLVALSRRAIYQAAYSG